MASTRPGKRPWTRIIRITQPIFASEIRWKAILWLGLLLVLLLTNVRLGVLNNRVGGEFMSAISERNSTLYRQKALETLAIFGMLTLVASFLKFSEERLGLLWRGWLTENLIDRYLANRAYFRLMSLTDLDNPDQRISEDVKNYTATTLSFLILLLNASITAIAFCQVLWGIDPLLVGVAIGYAVVGSLLTILVGRKLVSLNNLQLKKEANFRYELIHVREYADSIAILRGEPRQKARLDLRLGELVANFRIIVGINRNLTFTTAGYNFLMQIIPVLIVAPALHPGRGRVRRHYPVGRGIRHGARGLFADRDPVSANLDLRRRGQPAGDDLGSPRR